MRPIRTSQFTLAQRRLVATVLLRKGAASLSLPPAVWVPRAVGSWVWILGAIGIWTLEPVTVRVSVCTDLVF